MLFLKSKFKFYLLSNFMIQFSDNNKKNRAKSLEKIFYDFTMGNNIS